MHLHPNKRFKKDEPVVELLFQSNLIELEVIKLFLF
jgi:hypothetical protein